MIRRYGEVPGKGQKYRLRPGVYGLLQRGDAVLLTAQSVDALGFRPPGLIDRGSHALKGKSAVVHLYALPND